MWLPCVQGRLGWSELCPGEGLMTPTPGPLGHHSGLEISKVPAAELFPWKENSNGLFWLLGLSLVAGQENLQSSLWWGIN